MSNRHLFLLLIALLMIFWLMGCATSYTLAGVDMDVAEGELVGLIGKWGAEADGLILNAAAYTHTSVAVRDAVSATGVPVVELHLTNPAAREEFRKRNLLEDVVVAGIRGFGVQGYRLALEGLVHRLRESDGE